MTDKNSKPADSDQPTQPAGKGSEEQGDGLTMDFGAVTPQRTKAAEQQGSTVDPKGGCSS